MNFFLRTTTIGASLSIAAFAATATPKPGPSGTDRPFEVRLVDDATGLPVEDAIVDARFDSFHRRSALPPDAPGAPYRFDPSPTEPFSLEVHGNGWIEMGLQEFDPGTRGLPFGVSIRLGRSATLAGNVLDDRGRPVANARIFRGDRIENREASGPAPEAFSDANGAFVLADVGTSEIRLSVRAEGFLPQTVDWPAPFGRGRLAITLEKGESLDGWVTDEAGYPVEGARISVDAAIGSALSGEDGAFRISGLPREKAALLVRHPKFRAVTLPVLDPGADAVHVRLEPYQTGSIRVWCRGITDGWKAVRVTIEERGEEPENLSSAGPGFWTASDVRAGVVTVTVFAENGSVRESRSTVVEVLPGREKDVEVDFGPAGQTGDVTDLSDVLY